jgi:hypothetical protein
MVHTFVGFILVCLMDENRRRCFGGKASQEPPSSATVTFKLRQACRISIAKDWKTRGESGVLRLSKGGYGRLGTVLRASVPGKVDKATSFL